MNTPQDSSLGHEVVYPTRYDAGLLFPIPRAAARKALGLASAPLPFIGYDRWHAYELSWLNMRGKPMIATSTFWLPSDSPNLIESKSLKLYLNSLNGERFPDAAAIRDRIIDDLGKCAGATVEMIWGLPATANAGIGDSLDAADLDIDDYGPPNPAYLRADHAAPPVEETLYSQSFKSNCPVTGQPDWASIHLHYHGPRIEREGLLRYLASFREHAGFHEQCVERIFHDLCERCRPQRLSVEARYTRRGGLDINPWRASPGCPAPMALRDERQ
ncbi:MAG: NADPH-dependent 7-cyano-7-deazaguanine reductase QueF [Xanthomonadaceae bacterium]|jgi:7-cyano-7-deazaguanine reductase|nr:NADPH-dependent 7-cyano-7-deazaguanine reductase QueF [Xanthomonadaceae bacterium]